MIAEKQKMDEMVKVQFYDKDVGYENIWATPVGNDRYRLESIPYFIYGTSLYDIVEAKADPHGRLQFIRVVESSGNRTLRARVLEFTLDDQQADSLVQKLKELGCSVELLMPRLIAIDVPRAVDVRPVTTYLTDAGIRWEWANPTLDELDKTVT